MLRLPAQIQRTTGKQSQYHRLSGSYQCLQQIFLRIRNLNVCTRRRLPAHLGTLTQCSHNHIGRSRHAQSLSPQLTVIATCQRTRFDRPFLYMLTIIHVASFGIRNRSLITYRTTESFVHRHMTVCLAIHVPRAAHIVLRIGHRPNQCNASLFLQRQQLTLVLQQHKRFGRNLTCRFTIRFRKQFLAPSKRITILIRILKQS